MLGAIHPRPTLSIEGEGFFASGHEGELKERRTVCKALYLPIQLYPMEGERISLPLKKGETKRG